MTSKEMAMKTIQELPDTVTWSDIEERIRFLAAIDKGLDDIKTGKVIKPMAASKNPERFQDSKKVEKWFLRNCKWTFGRQCTVQEKIDTLSWLNSF